MLLLIWRCVKDDCKREVMLSAKDSAGISHFTCKECNSMMANYECRLRCDTCALESGVAPVMNSLSNFTGWYRFSCGAQFHDDANWTSGFLINDVNFENEKCFDRWLDENRHLIIHESKRALPASEQKPFI